MLNSLRKNILAGLFVLAPLGAVLWILLWLWDWINNLADLIPDALHPVVLFGIENPIGQTTLSFGFTLIIFLVLLFLVWLIGLISRNYFGKRLLKAISKGISRIPVLRTVYSTLEQLLQTFAAGQGNNFRRVVYLEYPRKGIFTLAFVTGDRDTHPITKEKGKFYTIYVPTTPNPTSGFYLTISADEVRESSRSVEEALKEIISMGMVASNDISKS